MAKVTDPLTLDEIRKLEPILQTEINKIPIVADDEEIPREELELRMIQHKLFTMKKVYLNE